MIKPLNQPLITTSLSSTTTPNIIITHINLQPTTTHNSDSKTIMNQYHELQSSYNPDSKTKSLIFNRDNKTQGDYEYHFRWNNKVTGHTHMLCLLIHKTIPICLNKIFNWKNKSRSPLFLLPPFYQFPPQPLVSTHHILFLNFYKIHSHVFIIVVVSFILIFSNYVVVCQFQECTLVYPQTRWRVFESRYLLLWNWGKIQFLLN